MNRLVLFLAIISLITINPRINGWNEASRMALTQALVEDHTFIIDGSEFAKTGDKVFVNGHYYSDKPPLPSILGAFVYFPLFHLGLQLDYGWNAAYYLIILFTIKLWWFLSVLAFGRTMDLLGVESSRTLILMLVYAFSSLAFSWSATFNNHSLAASWLMIGFLFYLKFKHSKLLMYSGLAGLFLGLAAASDVPTTLFLVGFALLIYMNTPGVKAVAVFFTAGMIPLALYGLVNYQISGGWLPLQVVPAYFEYPGSVWTEGATGQQANGVGKTIVYGVQSLLGTKGWLWHNPMLVILIPLLIRDIRSRHGLRGEGMMIATVSALIMLYYSIYSDNFSGWSYSIRWFVPLLPLFYIFLYRTTPWLEKRRWLLPGIALLGAGIALIGLINPWSNPELHAIPMIANIKQLLMFLSSI